MGVHGKYIILKKHTSLICCVFSFICLFLSLESIHATTSGDTAKAPSSIRSITKQLNAGQSLDNKHLSKLVDQLFDMETIPEGLIDEVSMAIATAKNKSTLALVKNSNSFPAADLYTSWEINNLFPKQDMLKMKGDTSVNLLLEGEVQGDYFHPYNGTVTSEFGWRDSAQHNGIDIDLNKGDKVAAAFDGMVRVAKNCGGFGNVVIVRHYNGLETVYGHLSKIKVKPGQVILAGQVIGLGGNTGHSTGSHLHFELRFKGVPINPRYLISFSGQKLVCNEITIKKTKWGLAAYPTHIKVYQVQKGDTVFDIAKHYATTTTSIKEMNGLPYKTRLKVGQVINVVQ
jgi:murein DD-endopeptidase MepM/ murein hydrolase activator NlpD